MKLIEKYFPYSVWRRYQREIAEVVYSGVVEGKVILIGAPTGLGKTAAVLAGVLAAIEDMSRGKVFFLVKTKNEAQAPFREIKALFRRGIPELVAVFRNKREMCSLEYARKLSYEEFLEECRYLTEHGLCEYAKNVKNLGVDEVEELILQARSPNHFIQLLKKRGYCPYEVCRVIASRAKVIIGSYHYVFSSAVRYAFFNSVPLKLGDLVLVIDEAHNLPQSIMDIETASLSEVTLRLAEKEVKRYLVNPDEKRRALFALKAIEKIFRDVKKRFGVDELEGKLKLLERSFIDAAFEGIYYLMDVLPKIIQRKKEVLGSPIISSPLRRVIDFYRRIEKTGIEYALFITYEEGIAKLVYKCVDPSTVSRHVLSAVHSAILMSGTLPPLQYFTSVLGLRGEQVTELRIDTKEFIPRENITIFILTDVTTRYIERSEDMYRKIATAIAEIHRVRKRGCTLVVVPSYSVLRGIKRYLPDDLPAFSETTETTVDDVIKAIEERKDLIIMAIAGGKIIEGVEFRGNTGENFIKTVVIVGVPYPEPDDFIKKYYDSISSRLLDQELAWSCVFTVPAMTKVKQAIGRAFRSERDRAVIVLMDYRYRDPRLLSLLSDVVDPDRVIVAETLDVLSEYLKKCPI